MDSSAADDRLSQLAAHSGPPRPMHRPLHNLPPAPPPYDRAWTSYTTSHEAHHPADPRHYATHPPPHTLPAPGYPPNPSRQLPYPEVSYGRQNSLPAVAQSVGTPPIASIPPMNGIAPDTTPQSAPADYRHRKPFQSPEQHNGDAPTISIPHTQYSSPAAHFAHTPTYDPVFYLNQAGAKRKPGRAQQACDQCRARKAKCDEGRPSCGHCRENNFNCVYKEIPPHKQERSTQLIMDRLDQMQSAIDRLEQAQQSILSLLTRDSRRMDELPRARTGLEGLEAPIFKTGSNAFTSESPSATHNQRTNVTLKSEASANTPVGNNADVKDEITLPGVTQSDSTQTDATKPEAEKKDSDGQQKEQPDPSHMISSIPVEHSTGAHKLLRWRWIKHLLSPDIYDEDYVMSLEEDRGLIRVYGLGEGDDASEDVGTDSPRGWDEKYTSRASPSGPCPPSVAPPSSSPGLDVSSGIITTEPETVRRYHQSYLENMYRLHPFFNEIDLARKVENFIKAYCPPKNPAMSPVVSADVEDVPRGAKRKRSGDGSQGPWRATHPRPNRRRVERTIDNAVVLLVLAVGSICECRDGLRLPQHQSDAFVLPVDSQGRLTSRGGLDARRLRNLDVVPGLAYYAYATDILGNLQGAVRVPHVQSALLAGIYAGQLAHPFQSHGWIFQAARACHVLNRAKRFNQLEAGSVRDLHCFIFWSCFQLESDIRAELDLPDSGISNIEGRIMLPSAPPGLRKETEQSNTIMILYFCQVHLRKVLNRIHTALYKSSVPHSGEKMGVMIEGLDLWRSYLPQALQWKDGDEPADDINIARLRAKYYGGRYIVNRPVLYHCLEAFDPDDETANRPNPRLSGDMGGTSTNGRKGPLARQKESPLGKLPPELRRACKLCVDSAVLSTLAFDGVKGGRPVVTNIFGTGHAQFGNMLVLAATYISPLGELVDREKLERLFRRTIGFLEQSRDISPTLRTDAEILRKCYAKIFKEDLAATSFLSQSSDQTVGA